MKSWLAIGKTFVPLTLFIASGLLMSRALAQPTYKDFDVVATTLDANSFPLNPQWGQQVRNNTLPSPKISCPVDDQNTANWTSSTQYPNCTSFPVSFNSGWLCGHHVNFLPVAYEGSVAWASGPNWFDHDYSFDVTRPDLALYSTVESEVHVEFDATETVDNWDGTQTWWDTFHHQAVDKGDSQAAAMINGRTVIVIGLLGMDTQHAAKTELHPIYAMFVLLGNNIRNIIARRQTSWAFFARNWGNEGYCGDNQENMYDQTLKVQIDNAGPILSSNIWGGARNTNDTSALSISAQPKTGAIILTLNLLPPDKQSWIMGDITFQQPQAVFLPSVGTAGGAGFHPRPESEGMNLPGYQALRAKLDKLPASSRKELVAQQRGMVATKLGKRLQLVFVQKPTLVGNTTLKSTRVVASTTAVIREAVDPAGRLKKQKQLELLRKFVVKKPIKPQS